VNARSACCAIAELTQDRQARRPGSASKYTTPWSGLAHDLFDALLQRQRAIVEQQLRLVERIRAWAHRGRDFRQFLEQFESSQQERRIQRRLQDQLIRREDVDQPAVGPTRMNSARSSAGSPKNVAAGILQGQNRALVAASDVRLTSPKWRNRLRVLLVAGMVQQRSQS
jgi:hypothetical protein